jgi:hypothetical protein
MSNIFFTFFSAALAKPLACRKRHGHLARVYWVKLPFRKGFCKLSQKLNR